jgi:flagellar biosynthesis activator protein FlaF
MQTMNRAADAYQQAASHRGLREQEAEVFRHATGALRAARDSESLQRTRAIADNRRLWLAVHDLVSDPDNALPASLRASIVSVGLAVQREMERESPDLEFLISINENITAGLSGRP